MGDAASAGSVSGHEDPAAAGMTSNVPPAVSPAPWLAADEPGHELARGTGEEHGDVGSQPDYADDTRVLPRWSSSHATPDDEQEPFADDENEETVFVQQRLFPMSVVEPSKRDHRRAAAAYFPRRVIFVRWATALLLVAALAVTGYGAVNAQFPHLTPVDLTEQDLPPQFDGFTIALVSDIHLGPGISGSFVDRLVDQVDAAKPDLIVIAGDLIDGTVAQLGPELEALTRLSAPYGVLITTGNHEFFYDAADWFAWFAAHGLTVLDNSGVQLLRNGATIDVLGINDSAGTPPHTPDLNQAVQRLAASTGAPVDGAGRFRLLIAHEPSQATSDDKLAARLGVDVQFSGHTHGGQMWPITDFVTLVQPVVDGVHEIGGVTVVTSRGAGAWGPPVRVGAPPEIPLITLHATAAPAADRPAG